MINKRKPILGAITFSLSLALIGSILNPREVTAQGSDTPSMQVIVKWRTPISIAERSAAAIVAVQAAERRVGVSTRALRRTATGAEVLRLNRPVSQAALTDFIAAIRNNPNVEYVEEDLLFRPAFTPNDPRYNEQWHYFEATAGINLPRAWDISSGSGITVAVLDTGYRPHADLAANIVGGYDFISDLQVAQDGNGRDADASDPGDWNDGTFGQDPDDWYLATACPVSGSSWHGTHVAGTIAAVTNNGTGVSGVAFGARILPVRVLGRCGGHLSDIADAIIWAAGGSVAGVPANPYPARVLNLSLGARRPCETTMQTAINVARTSGAVVVVAAGNNNADALGSAPANCSGVITVAAVNRSGAKAAYSNYGSVVDVAAPGGDGSTVDQVLSTMNSGIEGPGLDTYDHMRGTSMATPHVAGVAALILSRAPSLTPDEVESLMRNTARSFSGPCSGCGAGIVNAHAAVLATTSGIPSVPASIGVNPSTSYTGSYSVFWSSSPGASHYVLERNRYETVWGGTVTVTGTSKTYSNEPSSEYTHRIKACNAFGCSGWRTGAPVLICRGQCQ